MACVTGAMDHIISYHTIKTADVDYDDIISYFSKLLRLGILTHYSIHLFF